MTNDSFQILLFSPLIMGTIIAAINSDKVNDTTEKAEAWIRRTQSNAASENGWFNNYIIYPILWVLVQFSNWTDSFSHRGLKNGTRVTASLYLAGAWCYLIFALVMTVVKLILVGIVLYIIFKIFINSNEDVRKGFESGKRIIGSVGPGKRINPETGIIQKEGLIGWNDTEYRVNPETGKLQKEGLIGWNDTETRIDQETGIIQKEGLIGYNDSDIRINPETGIIQKRGLIGWDDTDKRVDPQTGRHQKKGLIGWDDE